MALLYTLKRDALFSTNSNGRWYAGETEVVAAGSKVRMLYHGGMEGALVQHVTEDGRRLYGWVPEEDLE